MRRGVFDVLPADALINLTAEDMRLILCGSQDINLQILQSFTKFFDESSAPANVLAKYKKNFWIVVNKFSNAEKQVFFKFYFLIYLFYIFKGSLFLLDWLSKFAIY